MQRGIALALVAAGCFLLVLAGSVRFWIAEQLSVMPINLYLTLRMDGEATYLDIPTGAEKTGPVTSTLTIRGDVEASTDKVAVLDLSTVAETPEGTVLQATTERIALDRRTAHTVNCCDESVNDVPVKHQGWGFVFPSGTQQRDYPLWDNTSSRTYDAHYRSQRRIAGHNGYVFEQEIPAHQVSSAPGAGPLVGEAPDFAVPIVAGSRSVFVIEPTTGQPLAIELHVKTTMQNSAGDDVRTVFAADLATAESGPESPAAEIGTQLRVIGIMRLWGPLAATVVGVALLAAGLVLSRRRRPGPPAHEPQPASTAASAMN